MWSKTRKKGPTYLPPHSHLSTVWEEDTLLATDAAPHETITAPPPLGRQHTYCLAFMGHMLPWWRKEGQPWWARHYKECPTDHVSPHHTPTLSSAPHHTRTAAHYCHTHRPPPPPHAWDHTFSTTGISLGRKATPMFLLG